MREPFIVVILPVFLLILIFSSSTSYENKHNGG